MPSKEALRAEVAMLRAELEAMRRARASAQTAPREPDDDDDDDDLAMDEEVRRGLEGQIKDIRRTLEGLVQAVDADQITQRDGGDRHQRQCGEQHAGDRSRQAQPAAGRCGQRGRSGRIDHAVARHTNSRRPWAIGPCPDFGRCRCGLIGTQQPKSTTRKPQFDRCGKRPTSGRLQGCQSGGRSQSCCAPQANG